VVKRTEQPSPFHTPTLLPDRLKALWQLAERGRISPEEYEQRHERLLDRYRALWRDALLLESHSDLEASVLAELRLYLGRAEDEIARQCRQAVAIVRDEWHQRVAPGDSESVEQFYDESDVYIYNLMSWHTLRDDDSPLAYAVALDFAKQQGCMRCLDFGCGVGSGNILFARNGLDVSGADISSVLLEFAKWRLELRELPVKLIDTKTARLPAEEFDIVTAMDTFEHLVDPVETVERLWESLKWGGFLLARINAEQNDDHPEHIVEDFRATFERMDSLGFVEVWRDEWLWGHQAFQKRRGRGLSPSGR
jgi:2-polyprenyl-3-methyl-5-hydroxy-6-metoxy-1,4-benzoquinol methylase